MIRNQRSRVGQASRSKRPRRADFLVVDSPPKRLTTGRSRSTQPALIWVSHSR